MSDSSQPPPLSSQAAHLERLAQLRGHASQLCDEALKRLTDCFGDEDHGPLSRKEWRRAWRTRLRYLLSVLVQSQYRQDPLGFANQVSWARVSAAARGVLSEEFVEGLWILRDLVEEALGPYRWTLAPYFAELDR